MFPYALRWIADEVNEASNKCNYFQRGAFNFAINSERVLETSTFESCTISGIRIVISIRINIRNRNSIHICILLFKSNGSFFR